jgi:hypothetical protein
MNIDNFTNLLQLLRPRAWVVVAFAICFGLTACNSGSSTSSTEGDSAALQSDTVPEDIFAATTLPEPTMEDDSEVVAPIEAVVEEAQPWIEEDITEEAYNGKSVETSGWKTLRGDEFAIQYPTNWKSDASRLSADHCMIKSQLESGNDQFQENFNLTAEDLPPRIGLNEYRTSSLEQIGKMFPDAKVVEDKFAQHPEGQYFRYHYKTTFLGLYLEYIQCVWVKGRKAYVLTFASEASHFSKFKGTAEAMIQSFRIE